MKLCIDCKHIVPPKDANASKEDVHQYSRCRLTFKPSPVNGIPQPIASVTFCYLLRDGLGSDYCGPEGRFWTPKD